MSHARWLVDRLAAMTPGEIAHRGRVAVRDRLLVPAWERDAPAAAFARLWSGTAADALGAPALRRWVRPRPTPSGSRARSTRPERSPPDAGGSSATTS